jgi:iron complex outermembrane receptor protein
VTLTSPEADRFNWIFGGFYKKEILIFPPNDGFVLLDATHYIPGVLVPEIVLLWRTPRTTEAVFGQAQYNITDALKLQVGLRYQHFITTEKADLSLLPTFFPIIFPTDIGDPTARGGKGGYNESTLTGKIALNYQLNDQHFLYAFVANGSTTGGVNVVFGLPNYRNQKTTDIEAGWKAQWLDRQLLTQIGGFYDIIDRYQGFATKLGLAQFTNLDGTSHVYGLEFSAQAVFDELSVDTGLSLIHSELGSGVIADPFGGPLNTAGKRQPFTPEMTFHAGAQYAFQFGDGTSLTPRVDVAYTSGQTTTPVDFFFNGVPLDRVPPHTLMNLKLTYGTEKWSGEFYMTNVTDEVYIEAHGGPGYNAYPNEPRRIGFRLHYSF